MRFRLSFFAAHLAVLEEVSENDTADSGIEVVSAAGLCAIVIRLCA
jgi:hypothetical protein